MIYTRLIDKICSDICMLIVYKKYVCMYKLCIVIKRMIVQNKKYGLKNIVNDFKDCMSILF